VVKVTDRKPEDFDILGNSTLLIMQGDYSQVSLIFRDGNLFLDADMGGEAFGEVHELTPERAEEIRDNLDAWLRWKGVEKAQLLHRYCPTCGKGWTGMSVPKEISQPRYSCPNGHGWNLVRGILLPENEEV
jgi:hypothetical protein